jgi:heptaprenyl diphosphate synthase
MKPIPTRQLTRLGLMGSIALILFVFEALAPRVLPWMKLGLGNLAVLLALLSHGFTAALGVSVVKLLVGGLISGSLGGPAFIIGGGAGLVSLSLMAGVRGAIPGVFSPVGLSILGALTHQLVQLLLASYLYVGQDGLFSFLQLFLVWGLISGTVIGLLAYWTIEKMRANGWLVTPPSGKIESSEECSCPGVKNVLY